ncbi:FecR family protein [Carboxylicivirga sp. N1Y90]|uniref:FecR family protein n=1 Tax=Carboxylicivirga fragile TaxID=3417571 RepID=UPI003D34B14E|nr:FecR family protein [Marinilabiliaceae bacterium N1Y90]
MNELNEIEQIIIRHLDNTATESELKRLNNWLEEAEENRKHYHEMKDVWDATPSVIGHEKSQKQWKKLNQSRLRSIPFRRISIELIKVAAVAVIALMAGYFFFEVADEDVHYATIEVPYGSKSTLKLPDGTNVTLNAGSKLVYPSNFSEKERNVELSGEAYFAVEHNPKKPFVVNVDDLEVRVLGTEFNVMAYPEFKRVETTLVSGKVLLNRKGFAYDDGIILKPGQKATYENNGLKIQWANIELECNWTQNEFYFESIPFNELMTRLEKWYDVTIEYNKEDFKDLTYTGKFRNEETVWQAFDAIRMTTPVDYTTEHRKVFITLKK